MKVEKEFIVNGDKFSYLEKALKSTITAITKKPNKVDNYRFMYISVKTLDNVDRKITWGGTLNDDGEELKKAIDNARKMISSITKDNFKSFYFAAKLSTKKY